MSSRSRGELRCFRQPRLLAYANTVSVTSFMSRIRGDSNNSPVSPAPLQTKQEAFPKFDSRQDLSRTPITESPSAHTPNTYTPNGNDSQQTHVQRQRASSRPMSMVQTYQPPLMDVAKDTLPELQPIFTFLNSHGNKLYQEGYFLKLDDQDTHGRPNADRTWTECFAQLVGTIMSLWDAAELDAAGADGEVLPKFINLTDSSIKMIESLPTRSPDEPPLQNVLSISTAGKNRYLLHFNSHHSLVQWTAGIRLAMFEHATLQEAYTGALIAGKGKSLNNISLIMERAKVKTEDWARVRFGAGTPWRRCWCVITPPDEKEVQKLKKEINKKKSAYDRSRPPVLKGDIKFYDTKKTKKATPIATITDAYTAFAIYPQAKPLIDASTLVKVEGNITIHSNPPSTTEGFVFVMPEVHPAVSGFEMMLRWLFPVFDTFALYGRPTRLAAEVKDPQSLMFAMPKHRRYGYLEIIDVAGLIVEDRSSTWKESEWRKRMKDLTLKRMIAIEDGSKRESRYSSRRNTRNSFGPSQSRIQFDDGASVRSSPSVGWQQGPTADVPSGGIPRTDSAPPAGEFARHSVSAHGHHRSVSETQGFDRYGSISSNYDGSYDRAPTPPAHQSAIPPVHSSSNLKYANDVNASDRISSEDDTPREPPIRELQDLRSTTSPEPVAPPPAFTHTPGSVPTTKPYHSPDLRRANSRMSTSTLSQLAGAGGVAGGVAAAAAYQASGDRPPTSESQRHQNFVQYSEDRGQKGVLSDTNRYEHSANTDDSNKGPVPVTSARFSFDGSPPRPANSNSQTNFSQPPSSFSTAPLTSQHRQAINRKALPPREPSMPTPHSTETTFSVGTLDQNIFDEAAFDMVKAPFDRAKTSTEAHGRYRSETMESSYDDDEPDYASSRPSMDNPPVQRRGGPRTGVMRTVGTVEDVHRPGGSNPSIPDVDFGPTLNLTSNRLSLPPSPGPRQARNVLASEPAHYRNDSTESRTLAWQPGMGALGASATLQSITPEQFVQQRASVTPQYAHGRQGSNPALGRSTPTPPLVKNRSSDRLAQLGHGHGRNSSTDLLQRPSSRGPSATLGGPAGNGDMPTTLSAREQEHVARVTGQPLINMAGNRNSQAPGAGLVGAIENREREKQQIKQGINSQAVQNAIAQRQSQAMHQQYQSQGHDYRTSQYGMGQYPQPQYHGQGQGYQSFVSPAAQIYAQGGGFSSPSPNTPGSMYPNSPDLHTHPGMPYSPPSQYFNQPHRPQGQGRGTAGYQGRQY
ncbi:hypothetical protein B0O99DRAFT_519609 [Bisporella sp. PMI_857]|nr:hypothetical protein B0O99DRAFT_519609 [Bisporella sp. PMI_857]